MKTFNKQEANQDFNHQESIVKTFLDLGYTDVKIETFLVNGVSHYVRFDVDVLNAGKLFHEMDIWEDNTTSIEIRISDHFSNLDKFGVSKNKMTMSNLMQLRETGAISKNN